MSSAETQSPATVANYVVEQPTDDEEPAEGFNPAVVAEGTETLKSHVRRLGGRRTRPDRRAGGRVRACRQRAGEHRLSAPGWSDRLARSALTAIDGAGRSPNLQDGHVAIGTHQTGRRPSRPAGQRQEAGAAGDERARGGRSGLPSREIFDALLQRERLGSTGVGDGVAIPHGKLAKCEHIFGVFARLERAIDFEAPDGLQVDLIFMLIAPEVRRRRSSQGAGLDRAPAAQRRHRRPVARDPRPDGALRAAHHGAGVERRLNERETAGESSRRRHAENRSARSAGQGDRGRAQVARDRRRRSRAPGQGVRHRDSTAMTATAPIRR